eukprot:CAMPEP_0181294470 /NCGR_PEP_ID=MMETSP1101-20121128/3621_1 /TAXON_ID=46948 /ORGANISM="Rhodomonas abbreviata, Strain Caron Lab Isolate" /LENGTH=384 /DNA_ID=CAMNT_0023399137 /DNA_START=412 /DNA_END=1564 /DNA_ORIENTATION=+
MDSYLMQGLGGIVNSLQDAADMASPVAQKSGMEASPLTPKAQEEDCKEKFVTIHNAVLGQDVRLATEYLDFVRRIPSHAHVPHIHQEGQIQSISQSSYSCSVRFPGSSVGTFSLGPEQSQLVYVNPREMESTLRNGMLDQGNLNGSTGRQIFHVAHDPSRMQGVDYIGFDIQENGTDEVNGMYTGAHHPRNEGPTRDSAAVYNDGVDKLVSMGFNKDVAFQAIALSGGDLQRGVEFAISGVTTAPVQTVQRPATIEEVLSTNEGSAADFWTSPQEHKNFTNPGPTEDLPSVQGQRLTSKVQIPKTDFMSQSGAESHRGRRAIQSLEISSPNSRPNQSSVLSAASYGSPANASLHTPQGRMQPSLNSAGPPSGQRGLGMRVAEQE